MHATRTQTRTHPAHELHTIRARPARTRPLEERHDMQTRLWLISHASTAAQRSATFSDANEPLDARGRAEATAYAQRARIAFDGAREVHALASPAACARETAQALGLNATVAAELADTDYGEWTRMRVADIAVQA